LRAQNLADTSAAGSTIEQIYHGRPRPAASSGRGREEPSIEQLTKLIDSALRAYEDVFRSNSIDAIAVPTVPVPAIALNPDDPMGLWTIEVNGKAMSVGDVLARGTFLAPRVGAPSLSLPVGLSRGLPVTQELAHGSTFFYVRSKLGHSCGTAESE
jgi:mandelamide amidase